MRKQKFIQKGLALFLLVVFALSSTPKPFFHDVLTNHQDEQVCQDQDKSVPHFHRPTFHCSFDDVVVSVPYLPVQQNIELKHPERIYRGSSFVPTFLLPTTFLHKESRGPPLM